MAVAAKKLQYEYGVPTTRVYSHAAQSMEAAARRDATCGTRTERSAAPRAHTKGTGKKLAALVCVGITVAVLAVLLLRYARITECYAAVNSLNESIEESERSIAALNVELNSVIDIDAARETALAAGLGYPTADQIVRISGVNSMESETTETTSGAEPDD